VSSLVNRLRREHQLRHINTMADADKATVTQAENASPKPRRRGCVGHCVRFWWVYLIALCVIVVVVVPCM
jgi:hypothetical protein